MKNIFKNPVLYFLLLVLTMNVITSCDGEMDEIQEDPKDIKIRVLEAQVAQLQRERDSLLQVINEITIQLEQKNEIIAKMKRELNNVHYKLKKARKDLKAVQETKKVVINNAGELAKANAKIRDLEGLIRDLENDKSKADKEVFSVKSGIEIIKDSLAKIKKNKILKAEYENIIQHAKLNLISVKVLNVDGKSKTNIGKKGRRWKNTKLQLKITMDRDKSYMLQGKRFCFGIWDVDNNKELSLREGKGNNYVELLYNNVMNFEFVNWEKKLGENYQLMIYLIRDDDVLMQLRCSGYPIIIDKDLNPLLRT